MAEDEQLMRVRYERNSDPGNMTQTIRLSGRDDVHVGGDGDVTMAEYNRLVAAGLVLTPIEGDESESDAPTVQPTVEVVQAPPKGKAKTAQINDSATAPSA